MFGTKLITRGKDYISEKYSRTSKWKNMDKI